MSGFGRGRGGWNYNNNNQGFGKGGGNNYNGGKGGGSKGGRGNQQQQWQGGGKGNQQQWQDNGGGKGSSKGRGKGSRHYSSWGGGGKGGGGGGGGNSQLPARQATLSGHTDTVTCLTVHEGKSQCFSGSKDGTIRIWGWANGFECQHTLPVGAPVECIMTLDSWLIAGTAAAGASHGFVKVWNMDSSFEQSLEGHQGSIYCLAQGGAYLFSGGDDAGIKTWQFNNDKFEGVVELKGHQSPIQVGPRRRPRRPQSPAASARVAAFPRPLPSDNRRASRPVPPTHAPADDEDGGQRAAIGGSDGHGEHVGSQHGHVDADHPDGAHGHPDGDVGGG